MTKLLETLINGKGKDLNLYNSITFVYCAFPDSLPSLTRLPSTSFVLVGDGI